MLNIRQLNRMPTVISNVHFVFALCKIMAQDLVAHNKVLYKLWESKIDRKMSRSHSEAVFQQMVTKAGLANHLNRFTELGWTTMGSFGFASGWHPGMPDDTRFFDDIVVS